MILVGSGSLGTGFKEQLLHQLSKIANTKVLVVCGKNEQYKNIWKKNLSIPIFCRWGITAPWVSLCSS